MFKKFFQDFFTHFLLNPLSFSHVWTKYMSIKICLLGLPKVIVSCMGHITSILYAIFYSPVRAWHLKGCNTVDIFFHKIFLLVFWKIFLSPIWYNLGNNWILKFEIIEIYFIKLIDMYISFFNFIYCKFRYFLSQGRALQFCIKCYQWGL